MKGGGLSYTLPAKRRWRGLVIAMLGLVLLSMLVPLVFLLGLHNGVHSDAGYPSGQNKPSSYGVRISLQHEVESTRTQLRKHNAGNISNQKKGDRSTHVDGLIQRFSPTLPKDFRRVSVKEATHKVKGSPVLKNFSVPRQKEYDSIKVNIKEATHKVKGIISLPGVTNFSRTPQKANDSTKVYVKEATHNVKGSNVLTNFSRTPQKTNDSIKVNVKETIDEVKGIISSHVLTNFSGPPQKTNDSTKVYVKEATHKVKGSSVLTNFSGPPQKNNDSMKVNEKEATHKVKDIISSSVLTNFSGPPQKANDSTKVVKESTLKVKGSSVLTNFSGPPQKNNDSMKVNVKEATHKVKDIISSSVLTNFSGPPQKANDSTKVVKEATLKVKGSPVLTNFSGPSQKENGTRLNGSPVVRHMEDVKDENESLCEMKFGSYCLWRQQRAEKMKDSLVKRMKDQLFMARAYYPSITKLPAHDKLSQELKQNIQEFERVLSETTTDSDLPREMKGKLGKMEAVMARAKSVVPMKSINVEKKFRQLVDLTEDEASFHMKQSAFFYQLAVQTMAKSLHCLSMRLTTEYFRSPPPNLDELLAKKYTNPTLHHYVIFSNNVLASSVVINSTVMHSKVSKNQVFHILTDRQNYFAMKLWFNKYNSYMEATVRVLNFEDPDLIRRKLSTPLSLSLPEEFRITFNGIDKSKTSSRTEYISMFSHSHYLLPEIFHPLNKVVVLDDDIVVQRDLSGLWSLNLKGKVNGAVQFCAVRFGQLKSYLGDNIKDETSCSWMSGLNIVDLDRWRKQNLTATFQKLLKEPNKEGNLYPSPTLRASLLAFEGLFHPLNNRLVVSGLGHYYSLDTKVIKEASVLHYNGNMKPWIDMGIPKYRTFWRKFVDSENQLLNDCNVNS
ncbi:probable galacturonosyltransferase 7 isoform X2 [Impatiens glandulifera]|uniref:probable galacturonosyltransferase 7 isoform X2 n=1 Tax=Impatiens glandulifera TaxID=253017 RepID=UPI001FB1698D|nr:probable galacturonosyltransferase 7 isoform X2 [Impatiens glandulifera]